jgi:hypothetical protein
MLAMLLTLRLAFDKSAGATEVESRSSDSKSIDRLIATLEKDATL